MIIASKPGNEIDRLSELKEYRIMDTIPESDFDDITMLASQICGTPISLVSLVDEKRQWFKSHHGLSVRETPRELAFCAHAINTAGQIFIVNDSRDDVRFYDNPLVIGEPHVIFYAGVPLVTPGGNPLGTLCVIDSRPRELADSQLRALQALTSQVMCQLELRKKNSMMNLMYDELVNNYNDIEQFAAIAAHDLRSPLHNITSLIDFFLDDNQDKISENGIIYLGHIKTSSLQLTRLIDSILEYSKSTQVIATQKTEFSLYGMVEEIIQLLKPPLNISVLFPDKGASLVASRVALKQVLLNLINNAIKYNNRVGAEIRISFAEVPEYYHISVADNGEGIPAEHLGNIFDLFKAVKLSEHSGTGIGLSIVKRLIKKMHGDITVESKIGLGTTFSFTIKK